MPHLLSAFLAGSALVCSAEPTRAQAKPAAPEIRWEPYTTQGADGQPLVGELGRLRVPENRARPEGQTIELAFVRFKSSNPAPGPPLVYLVGGPGPSGIEHCVAPATGRMLRLLDFCDVIGLDQRGTGLSRPNLEQGPSFAYELPAERAITRADVIAAYSEAVTRCVSYWKEQGVDLSAYNTRESAADVEDLRRALGLERIQTWGESYGTHLSLAYLRDYGAHVARSILIRVEGPDHTWKLPSTTQRHLEQLHELVAADPGVSAALPDFLAALEELLEGLAHEPVTVEVEAEGATRTVVVGPYDVQHWLANTLGLAFELRDVPATLYSLLEGDWSVLGAHALENRRGEVGSAMALMMDCSSGASAARLARIAKEAADPRNLLADAVNVPYPAACAACGSPDLGDDFRAPLRCDVPVLFVSGGLDARTPPENVEELRAGFSNHAHVLASTAGHESIEMLAPEYRALLAAFLRGERVASRTIELPPVRFRPIRTD